MLWLTFGWFEQVIRAQFYVSSDTISFLELPSRGAVASGGSSRTEPLGPIAKAMVSSMTEALKIPHFGYNEEYDLTNLVELRKQLKPMAGEYDIKLSYMPFIIKVNLIKISH